MIRARGLTKRYGPTLAVDNLDFEVLPGRVTGFLGPNGAGKSTTMRMILGLDAPTAGSVTIDGRPYAEHQRPLFDVGAMLEARAIHPGRSAYNHLFALAQSNGIGRKRVDEVLDVVGLSSVAHKRAGGFSLGMGQRLGLAAALLGDPGVLILDEPVNGLDPEGIVWIRNLMRSLASEGRAVFVSSHLLTEMALTADHLIVVGRGRLIAESSVDEFIERSSRNYVRVRAPQLHKLGQLLTSEGAAITMEDDGALAVTGAGEAAIGDLAAEYGITLHELSPQNASLEEAYIELTQGSVDFHGADTASHPTLTTQVA
ncbi:MAG: multidrug transporter ATP-binding protein [Actinomycetia bacterium]|jgi:ABC-2 type transport system ATP-binding protein|nr:multidrug transporter ATP-binding protein [Actinomycetes bacterium]